MSCSTFSNGFTREAYPAIGTDFSGVILIVARPAFHSASAAFAQSPAMKANRMPTRAALLMKSQDSIQNLHTGLTNRLKPGLQARRILRTRRRDADGPRGPIGLVITAFRSLILRSGRVAFLCEGKRLFPQWPAKP